MAEIRYHNRRAHSLENEHLQIVVTVEGGHIAAIIDKATRVNPLWTPPWPSIEPSQYDPAAHPEYGQNAESKLLAGIMGHNLCLDLFGGPSEAEAAAGLPVHGEGSVAEYAVRVDGDTLTQAVTLPTCQLAFERAIRLAAGSRAAEITETVENLSVCDRPIAWTHHVTIGPPFVERGKTRFEMTATRSKTFEGAFAPGHDYLAPNTEFDWPMAPRIGGGTEDLRVYTSREASGAFTTHLMDPSREHAWFAAVHPELELGMAYIWRQADFPWLGIWEENQSRTSAPWNGKTLTRGMEFGVSPMPESRRAMIERGSLFGVPGYRWAPAKSRLTVSYKAMLAPCAAVEDLKLP